MAYANAHVKVVIFGDMYTGAEEWSTGFRIGSEDPGSGNFGVSQDWVNALRTPWQNLFTGATEGFSYRFRTLGIKASLILADGTTDLDEIKTATYATPIVGGSASAGYPPQVTLVAQLRASSPTGLGAKGRMYLPGQSYGLDGTGHISGSDTARTALGLRTFLDAAETATDSPGYIINASKGRVGIPYAAPVNRRVTMVRVGDVFDTQRRRRNALTEAYAESSLAA
jgi:hypothetical protein